VTRDELHARYRELRDDDLLAAAVAVAEQLLAEGDPPLRGARRAEPRLAR
jgi:hypothetical protein